MLQSYSSQPVFARVIPALLPLLALVSSSSLAAPQTQRETHPVVIADPASASAAPRRLNVVLSKDRNGFPDEYAATFETSVCTDGQCRLLEVTMVWTATGHYERLRCPPGKPLTKKEHTPLTRADYVKLDHILKNPDSVLADWKPESAHHPQAAADGVDAVTMPTPITVKSSVVQDAAYTTWTLWQWANGPIVPKLRAITNEHCSAAYLNHLLVSQDRRDTDYALDYVIEHHPGDPQFAQSVYHVLEHGGREQITTSLKFLSGATTDKQQLHDRLVESCVGMRSADCPIILQELAAQPDLTAATLEGLTGKLKQLPYYPTHLILRMLEARQFASTKTLGDVTALLEGDNFFIARRAYEHLIRQDLDADTQNRVDAFRARNRDRL
jgi:hypothetical protein